MKKDEFIKEISKLVAFQTVTDNPEANSRALDYVQTLLDRRAVVTRIKNKNTEILIAANSKTDSPDVGYLVHTDVVAGRPDQFKFRLRGDRAIGRGTCDMKFSIPLGVGLLNDLISTGSKLSFSLGLTTDEETGGWDGGSYLAEVLKFRPACLIVPDGGYDLCFVNKAKGVCQLMITSSGSTAHASRPWMGKNALDSIILLGRELLNIYGPNSLRENWGTTMNIGQIQGGTSVNQVCSKAVMKIDFRYPETDSVENITRTVKKLAGRISPGLVVGHLSTGLPTFTDTDLPVVNNFLVSMGKAYGRVILISQNYGASDARHFAKYDIPVLMMKPLGGEIHSEDEWVSVGSCLKFFRGLKIFLEKMEANHV